MKFVRFTGSTPYLGTAYQDLMEFPDSKPIEEIAQTCGFGSQQYLGNVFKQHLGISPGKCRKDYRESYLK